MWWRQHGITFMSICGDIGFHGNMGKLRFSCRKTTKITDNKGATKINSHKFLNFLNAVLLYSSLVISKSKGLSEIHRNIHTLTYQICKIEEKK